MLGAASNFIDAADIPLAAKHGVVGAVLVDPGAKAGRAHCLHSLEGSLMERYYGVAIVTLVCSLVIFGMAFTVSKTHAKTGILAPAMVGDPYLERAIRAHSNTLEWLPIFLPSMWLFAIYWSASWATGLGAA
jgi:hypothetical protein